MKNFTKEYPFLNKPCYTENLNFGQKNLKETFTDFNLLYVISVIILNIAFVISHS